MNQKLVTKKNRKLRLLRELYPELRCKLLYQRDYMQLVAKYGLEDPEHLDAVPPPSRLPGKPVVTRLDDRGSKTG